MLPPAKEMLDPANRVKPAWAYFDAEWYRKRYATKNFIACGEASEALGYYLAMGAGLGHSPSPLFDEIFYISQHPEIAELIQTGAYASGFDHFCQHGHRALSPHWLFDDTAYGRLHDDMSLENLDQHGFFGRYDHYLKSGQYEGRLGHFIFDPAFYRQRAIEAGTDPAEIDSLGPYIHYLYRLQPGLTELPPSIYFDPAWYMENSFGAKSALENGEFRAAIEHYLRSDPSVPRDPVPEFSEAFYRQAYHDIGHAIEAGLFRNGYQHFIQYGGFELRRPRHDINLLHYRDANPSVRDDLNTGVVRDAFAHLRLIGPQENFSYNTPDNPAPVNENDTKQIDLLKARNQLAAVSHLKLDFTCMQPAISVIMVLFDKFELTMTALVSLRNNYAGEIELVIIDNHSTDDTRWIGAHVVGAKIFRLSENIGFIRAANLALMHVTSAHVLYLNNDTELGHAAVASALARLNSAPDIGAVGGKILRSHGVLQEAGSIIWRDGHTEGYMRDASPLAGEVNFIRDVDYCSAVFLLCRGNLLKKLNGFDEAFSPAYYEDADLCVRMIQSGYRIVYDPAVTVHHLEFGSAANSAGSMALMRRGLKTFAHKHQDFLKSKLEPSAAAMNFARHAVQKRKRVLYFEDTVPLRHLGSGFVRANDIVHGIVAAGFDVSIFPINGAPQNVQNIYRDFPASVEVLHDRDINCLEIFLKERLGYYDVVWISRTHNLIRLLPVFEAAGISLFGLPLILDTEAVAAVREAARAGHTGGNFDSEAELRMEFIQASVCRHIFALNQIEMEMLQNLGLPAVSVLGTLREPELTPNQFGSRTGMLFVGAIHRQDSPNLDALYWYMNEILPALQSEMDDVPVLNIIGYTAKEVDLSAFRQNRYIRLHGAEGNLQPFYNSNRIFIAPTRFAAGTPYKLYEAASYGLPCVATNLLGRQLGWRNNEELLTAPSQDAKLFAVQIVTLYQDETLWTKLRKRAASRLAVENTAEAFNLAINDALHRVT